MVQRKRRFSTLPHLAAAVLAAVIGFANERPAHAAEPEPDSVPETAALDALNFAQRTLSGLLHRFQRAGFDIVFSDQLVRPDFVVTDNPPPGPALGRLVDTLDNFFLQLLAQEGSNTWYVVPADGHGEPIEVVLQDRSTRRYLSSVTVSSAGHTVASSNANGRVRLPLAGTLNRKDAPLTFVSPGYQPLHTTLGKLTNGEVITLAPERSLAVEEVLVTASQYPVKTAASASAQGFDTVELERLPLRGKDPVQVLNTLPGTAQNGVSAVPNIRGGARDELLILFDGVELTDPFHLKDFYGLISALNTDLLEEVVVYTGGYPARYGGKMSGVMDIAPRPAEDLANVVEWNVYATTLTATGHNRRRNLQGLLSLRRGNVDDVLDQVNEEIGSPQFFDGFASLAWQASAVWSVSAKILALEDRVRLNDLDEDVGLRARSDYRSRYSWLTLGQDPGGDYRGAWRLAHTSIDNLRQGQSLDPSPSGSLGTLDDQRDFDMVHLGYQGNLRLGARHELSFGLATERKSGRYAYLADARLGEVANLLGRERVLDVQLTREVHANEYHAYISDRYQPAPWLDIDFGLRYERQNLTSQNKYQVNPRLGAVWHVSDTLDAKLSAGRFYQAPDITELHITAADATFAPPQKSDHYILGLYYQPAGAWQVTFEAYQKSVLSPKPRFENLLNPYSLLPDIEPDRVELRPSKARAEGLEMHVQWAATDSLDLTFGYTGSRVTDTFDGQTQLRQWNQRHSLQWTLDYRRGPWQIMALTRWHSGWRTTPLPPTLESLETPITYQRNSRELPDYFVVDVKASYQWLLAASELEVYLDIANLTNRANTGYIEREIEGSEAAGYTVTEDPQPLLPILPSLGIRWTF